MEAFALARAVETTSTPRQMVDRLGVGICLRDENCVARNFQWLPRNTNMDSPRRLVLFIDDCGATRLLYQHVLTEAGYRVSLAGDGRAGVAKATVERPDLIITDLDMPVMDGFEATRQLRRDRRTQAIPIVVLTASPSRHCVMRAHEAGCDAYLTKPCPPGRLLEALTLVLRDRELHSRDVSHQRRGDGCASR
jgi:CheY-like chemotaxis protein